MSDRRKQIVKRLNRLFGAGPVIRHALPNASRGTGQALSHGYRKSAMQEITFPLGTYGNLDRISRLADYNLMDQDAVISSALDIYSDECTTPHEDGKILQVKSVDSNVKKLLEELYSDILNSEFWIWSWIRGMCKYGDYFLQLIIEEDRGVIDIVPLPVNTVERIENTTDRGTTEVLFKIQGMGYSDRALQTDQLLKSWEVAHFRLLGDDAFLPYGKAVIDPARRVFRQLEMLEDSMLVYRVTRAAERRIYYIEVGNLNPNEVESYVNRIRDQFKRVPVVNRTNGTYDLRYNPAAADEDFFIPVRSGEGSKIESLPGAQNLGDIEDVEYIQKKLFAALKIPKAFLTYEEEIAAKATLSQEDIRFSRTIQRIQKIFLAELSKIGIVHLVSLGFDAQDAMNFTLSLNNPSTASEIQKLELMNEKLALAESLSVKFFPRSWVYNHIFGIGTRNIDDLEKELLLDKYYDFKLQQVEMSGLEGLKQALEDPGIARESPSPAAGMNANSPGMDSQNDIPKEPRDTWRRNGKPGRPRKYPKTGASRPENPMGQNDPIGYKDMLNMSHRDVVANQENILNELTQKAIKNAENNEKLLNNKTKK